MHWNAKDRYQDRKIPDNVCGKNRKAYMIFKHPLNIQRKPKTDGTGDKNQLINYSTQVK